MDKSLVDYSKRSWTTFFVLDGCRYAISFMEEFFSDEEGIEPTGCYIITANSPKGTFTAKFEPSSEGFGWQTDEKLFINVVPLQYIDFINQQLKIR